VPEVVKAYVRQSGPLQHTLEMAREVAGSEQSTHAGREYKPLRLPVPGTRYTLFELALAVVLESFYSLVRQSDVRPLPDSNVRPLRASESILQTWRKPSHKRHPTSHQRLRHGGQDRPAGSMRPQGTKCAVGAFVEEGGAPPTISATQHHKDRAGVSFGVSRPLCLTSTQ
jgi:hypothetical protein